MGTNHGNCSDNDVSVFLSIVVGVPVGILAARSDAVDTGIRPVLDTMQTMPSFVYLVPGIMLFGLGNVAAIFAPSFTLFHHVSD
ncbi:MAG: hypothetical protein CM1200mP3_08830 [Chloroflexota bacterium]|nr:MAG: hypothetical protein CM1200mP3_08830 [Chloroflexota bacterium]